MGHPCKFQRVSRLGSVTALHCSSGRQPNFAALNRGRHLHSAGRPSRWALAHIFWLCFSSSNLSRRRLDVCHMSTHGVALVRICRSEMCCRRLAGNAGPKKSPKIRHLGTIAQLCRAISSQLRHVSTIEKLVKQRYLPRTSSQYGELQPTSG